MYRQAGKLFYNLDSEIYNYSLLITSYFLLITHTSPLYLIKKESSTTYTLLLVERITLHKVPSQLKALGGFPPLSLYPH